MLVVQAVGQRHELLTRPVIARLVAVAIPQTRWCPDPPSAWANYMPQKDTKLPKVPKPSSGSRDLTASSLPGGVKHLFSRESITDSMLANGEISAGGPAYPKRTFWRRA